MKDTAKILIVEHDALLRRFLGARLGREGYEICTANNSRQGLAVADTTPVSLIVTDLDVPGTRGLDSLRHLRAAKPHIATIVMSASVSPGLVEGALNLGAAGFLSKPFGSIDHVLDLVAGALEESGAELDSVH